MRAPSRIALWTSMWSGLAGGAVMLLVLLLFGALFRQGDLLFGARVFGALITREPALDRVNAQAMATGVFVHLSGPSLFWSRLFGMLRGFDKEPITLRHSILTGLGVALISELLDVRLLLPAIQRGTDGMNLWARYIPTPLDWTLHAVFGLTVGTVYFLLNRSTKPINRHERDARATHRPTRTAEQR